jgi:hypothetical protein
MIHVKEMPNLTKNQQLLVIIRVDHEEALPTWPLLQEPSGAGLWPVPCFAPSRWGLKGRISKPRLAVMVTSPAACVNQSRSDALGDERTVVR